LSFKEQAISVVSFKGTFFSAKNNGTSNPIFPTMSPLKEILNSLLDFLIISQPSSSVVIG